MMKSYFKKWQFWLRVFLAPIGYLMWGGSWVGEKITEFFDWLFEAVDGALPKIPKDKTELQKRFDKTSDKVDKLHK